MARRSVRRTNTNKAGGTGTGRKRRTAAAGTASAPATAAARKTAMKKRAAEKVGHAALAISTGVGIHSAHSLGYEKEATYAAAALFVGGTVASIVSPSATTDMLATVGNAAGAAQLSRVLSDKLLDWTGARPEEASEYAFGQFDDDMRIYGGQSAPAQVHANGGVHRQGQVQ